MNFLDRYHQNWEYWPSILVSRGMFIGGDDYNMTTKMLNKVKIISKVV